MNLPSAEQYVEIVAKKDAASLGMMRGHRFLSNADGTIFYKKGHNAIVFKTEYNGKHYAVRFFLQDDPELFRRYSIIQDHLAAQSGSWKVPFEFLEQGFYPVLRMDWVEGPSLADYLDLIINDPSLISGLQSRLVSLSRQLEENGIGHGDLNLNHIRVEHQQGQQPVLKLIDYDSMFVSALKGKDSLSVGTASFQYPRRLASHYSEKIDRFSIWVLLTALEAFKKKPSLWLENKTLGNDKSTQVLFNFRDLASPRQSPTFQMLKTIADDPLNYYLDKLVASCEARSLFRIDIPALYSARNISFNHGNDRQLQYARMDGSNKNRERSLQRAGSTTEQNTTPALMNASSIAIDEEEDNFVRLRPPVRSTSQILKPAKKIKTAQVAILIGVGALLIYFTTIFFIGRNSSGTAPDVIATEPPQTSKSINTVQPQAVQEKTLFTKDKVTQFLSGLYQSYNQRNLQHMMSHYADNVGQYYDAGAVTRKKLEDIISDLFIKPAYYHCEPNLATLQIKEQKDRCQVTVTINETIQANENATRENYSSKIEYMINDSFKITEEKNVE